MLNFSRKLRVYLAENNIKKKDFAIEIGVSPETISNWLHDKVKINRLHAIGVDTVTEGQITMSDMGY